MVILTFLAVTSRVICTPGWANGRPIDENYFYSASEYRGRAGARGGDVYLQQTSATRRSFPTRPITSPTKKARTATSVPCNWTVKDPNVTTSSAPISILLPPGCV